MAITSPRQSGNAYNAVPLAWGANIAEWVRKIAEAVNELRVGKVNTTGTVTLTANATTTTINHSAIGAKSVVLTMPTTQSAGGELGMSITTTEGVATVNHAYDSRTDRTFRYVIFG